MLFEELKRAGGCVLPVPLRYRESRQEGGKTVDVYTDQGDIYGLDSTTYLPGGRRGGVDLDATARVGGAWFGFQ